MNCKKVKVIKSFANCEFNTDNFKREYYCLVCRKKVIVDLDKLKEYLSMNNTSFNNNNWNNAYESIKERELKKYKNSDIPSNINDIIFKKTVSRYFSQSNLNTYRKQNKVKKSTKFISKNVSDELIYKWGSKYEPEDYMKLEEFYTKMKDFNKIETPQDEFYLKKLAVISLKLDKELEDGNYAQVKQLGDLFSKYMADSKFRAMDLTDATKSGGIRTFSQIYAEVERDGFIPLWEEYRKIKGLKQDIVDKTIMYILNYTLKLNKTPQMITPPSDTPKIDED